MMIKGLLLGLGLLSASAAHSTTINFESYPDPSDFTSFSNSGATFTAAGATTLFEISAYGQTWGTSGAKILCPYTAANYCGGDFNVTFAGSVKNLQFYFTGDNSTAALTTQAFLNGVLLGTVIVAGDGNQSTAQLVNLSGFGAIDKLVVTGASADDHGFGYDDFSFIAVPEPSTWAMMLLGFGAIGASIRRSRRFTGTQLA